MRARSAVSAGRAGLDWKVHLTFLLAAFVAGTVFGTTVLLPHRVVSLQNRLASQEDSIAKVAELQKSNAELRLKLDDTRSDLFRSEEKNIFLSGAPYPNGLDRVKIGDSIDKVFANFPDSAITKSLYYVRVDNQHPVFNRIFYYFYGGTTIQSIAFGLDRRKFGDAALKGIMVQVFGKPKVIEKNHSERYDWSIDGKYNVVMTSNDSYTLRLEE